MANLSKLIKKSSRKTRQENSAGKLGRKTRQENSAGKLGRKTWQENLAGKPGGENLFLIFQYQLNMLGYEN
jgi:hypothetical protein